MPTGHEAERAAWWAGVAALSPLPRAVFLMSGFDERSAADIAAALDVSDEAVRAALTHAICVVAEAVRCQVPDYEPSAIVRDAEAALLRRHGRQRPPMPFEDGLREGCPMTEGRCA